MKSNQCIGRITECFARRPKRVLGVAFALSILAVWTTFHLPVNTSRQALLPQNTEVAQRFNDFLNNFGAASDLIVVLEGAPRSDLESYADELSLKLRAEPEIGQATSRLDMTFFLDHAYLLMPLEGLGRLAAMANQPVLLEGGLEDKLSKVLNWSKNHPSMGGADIDLQTAEASLNLASALLEEWLRWLNVDTIPTGLDWNQLLAKTGIRGMTDGYFASRDGRMMFVFIRPKSSSGDFNTLGPFVDKVKHVLAESAEQANAAGRKVPTIGLTGLPAMEYEEYVNVRQDINLITITSAVLVAGLVLLVVRSLRWAALIFIPMSFGVVWSLGLALITVGHLTIITAAFIAILFGLGADYGIFTSSRIAEERRAGKPLVEAIGCGIGSSFSAVLTAGGASLLIFGTLATVEFPGFAELGVVAATGVLMILISTWIVQPALYVLLPPKLRELSSLEMTTIAGKQRKLRGAFPRSVAIVIVMLALGFAVFGGMKGFAIPFDYNLLAMLPEDSRAAYYQRRMVAESDYQSEVVIFIAKDLAEARRIDEDASRLETIAQTQSLTKLFPEDAEARRLKAISIGEAFSQATYSKQVAELNREGLSAKSFELLRGLLENAIAIVDEAQEQAFSAGHSRMVESLEKVRGQLSTIGTQLAADGEEGRVRSESFVRALLSGADPGLKVIDAWQQARPLSPERLPPTLRDRFFAADGRVAIYAFPAKTVYDPDNLDALMKDVYSISSDATGFPTTHQAFSRAVVESFSYGTQLALALCLFWVMAATRSVRGFALAALPLLIGGGWMLGIMSLAGINYNFANIVALPLVIALAVDYGVWFSYRWADLKDHSPLQVSVAVGKAIGLAAGTSLAGLGAISLASYRGVSSMGVSITIGLLCCLSATLFVAPAIGQLIDSKRKP